MKVKKACIKANNSLCNLSVIRKEPL